uniref:Uncharacterized protein n=1 Tax=viral metagenome TaxID=1070528 RepID=A0A6C0D9X5_9ZZZZ
MKGGRSVSTENERINEALNGNYTPLINAIIRGDINQIRNVLRPGEVANQRDNTYNWCPFKWLEFVRVYGNRYSGEDYVDLIRLLDQNGSRSCFDDYHIREDSYNFSPVVLDIDEQLERIRRENEEEEEDERLNTPNRINMARGRRRKKSRRSKKARKGKKSHKKSKRGSFTKRRKHMKK